MSLPGVRIVTVSTSVDPYLERSSTATVSTRLLSPTIDANYFVSAGDSAHGAPFQALRRKAAVQRSIGLTRQSRRNSLPPPVGPNASATVIGCFEDEPLATHTTSSGRVLRGTIHVLP